MLRFLLYTAILLTGLWFGGLLWFIQIIPSNVADNTTVTDGIVALTGGSARLSTAVSLLQEHKAKKLLITGVGKGITLSNLSLQDGVSETDMLHNEDNIVLGYIAKNTRQNAKEASIWVNLEGLRSLRIVTANYHIPRSILEFSYAMPNVTIIPHPVFPKRVNVSEWWRFPGSTLLIISEYHKYVGAYMQHKLSSYLHSLGQKAAAASKG